MNREEKRQKILAHNRAQIRVVKTGVTQAISESLWPDWIKKISEQRISTETGVGDTVERVIGEFGSSEFRVWYAESTSVYQPTCKCATWKPIWNMIYAYQNKS